MNGEVDKVGRGLRKSQQPGERRKGVPGVFSAPVALVLTLLAGSGTMHGALVRLGEIGALEVVVEF